MPDPVLYLTACAAAAGASALMVLISAAAAGAAGIGAGPAPRFLAARLLGLWIGIMIGCRILWGSWPASVANALDRFLVIILPATVLLELLITVVPSHPLVRWPPRIVLAGACGPILLHGSVYVDISAGVWSTTQLASVLCGTSASLILGWFLLHKIAQVTSDEHVTEVVVLCLAGTGLVTMLAGYIKGGAAAIPIVGAVLAAVLVRPRQRIWRPKFEDTRSDETHVRNQVSLTSLTLICLYSLLFISRFFGAVSSMQAITIFCTPMLCGVTLLQPLRRISQQKRHVSMLLITSIPLMVLIVLAWNRFQIRMGPLL